MTAQAKKAVNAHLTALYHSREYMVAYKVRGLIPFLFIMLFLDCSVPEHITKNPELQQKSALSSKSQNQR